ncbi:MAG: carbohydrate ABC transporter permease [Gaiellales bacterium]
MGAAAGRRRFRRTAPAAAPAPGEPRLIGYLYVLPALLVFAVFVIAPMADGFWISLFQWDGVTVGHWVGLDNYRQVLSDPAVRQAFEHSLVLIIFYSVLQITIGLVLTSALAHARVRGVTALQTVIFLPQVLAAVVIGVAWKWLYDPLGPINQFLGAIGLSSLERAWLGDFTFALPAIGVIGTWITTGLCVVLFMAGVQRIPLSRYEAARVDGAGPVREFFAVTLPGLRNELAVALSLTVITALRVFDIIYVTTKGGPGSYTTVPSLLIYQRAFVTGQVGSAAAIGAIMGVIILTLAVVITRVVEERT